MARPKSEKLENTFTDEDVELVSVIFTTNFIDAETFLTGQVKEIDVEYAKYLVNLRVAEYVCN